MAEMKSVNNAIEKRSRGLSPTLTNAFYPFLELGLLWQLAFLLRLVTSKHLNRRMPLNMLVSSGVKTSPDNLLPRIRGFQKLETHISDII